MRILKNEFLIEADATANETKKITNDQGEEVLLHIDTSWDKVANAVKFGKVYKTPMSCDEFFSGGAIEEGDDVCFHQHVVVPENIINVDGKDYYRAMYNMIFAVIKNDLPLPIDRWVFVDPIKNESNTTPGGIIMSVEAEFSKNKGIVNKGSDYAESLGLKSGDKVHFMKDADYPMNIGGKLYYRMRVDSIICIETKDALVPLSNKLIVKEHPQKEERIIAKREIPTLFGKILAVGSDIDDVMVGNEICFGEGIGTKTYFRGVDFRSIRRDQVVWEVVPKHAKNKLGIRLLA